MRQAVALWTPDIQPPTAWLVPAILYQDQIATFAPGEFLEDKDGRQSRRVSNLLGDLYLPLSLTDVFKHTHRDIMQILSGNLGRWALYAEKIGGNAGAWANQVSGYSSKKTLNETSLRTLLTKQRKLTVTIPGLRRQLEALDGDIAKLRLEREDLIQRRRPQLRTSKEKRAVSVEGFVAQKKNLAKELRLARGDEPKSQAIRTKVHDIDARILALRRDPDSTAETPLIDALENEITRIEPTREALKCDLIAAQQELQQTDSDIEVLRRNLRRPHTWPGRTDDLWNLPGDLETIAVGKFGGELFEFLSTTGGMWVSARPGHEYAGTLVGPKFLVEEVMEIAARFYASERPNFVIATSERPPPSVGLPNTTDEAYVSTLWRLPVPETTDLVALVNFRREHRDELALLKERLRWPLDLATNPDDIRQAIRQTEIECAGAVVEIEKALRLDSRLGLRHVRCSVLSELQGVGVEAIVGLTAGFASMPIFGSVPNAGSVGASAATSVIIGSSVHLLRNRYDRIRRQRLKTEVRGAYQYVYEANAKWREASR